MIAVVYNPPRINKLLFIDKLDQFLESLSKGLPVLIMGDINIDVLKQNDATLRYLATIEANGCNFLNNKITRPASNGGSCLDHAICKNFDLGMISVEVLMHENYSDHFPVLFQADLKSKNPPSSKYIFFRDTSYLKSSERINSFCECLVHVLKNKEINSVGTFHSTFIEVLNKYAPIERVAPSKVFSRPKYLTNRIINLVNKRNQVHHKWKNSKNPQYLQTFKELRVRVENELKNRRKIFISLNSNKCIGDRKQIYINS